MEQNQLIEIRLTDVNLGKLKSLFGRSLTCDSKLGFFIDEDATIGSYSGGNSFFKKWTDNLLDCCSKFKSSVKGRIKCFIYDGNKFVNSVLSSFGDIANISIFAQQMQNDIIANLIEVSNATLKIRVQCSQLRLGYVELDEETENSIFHNTTNMRQLQLTSQQFKTLSHFGSFNMLGKAVDGIELRTNEKGLIATDGSFIYVLDPNYAYDLQPISLNKSLIRFIDANMSYDAIISTTAKGFDVMTLKAKDCDLIMTMSLIYDNSAEFEDTGDELGF